MPRQEEVAEIAVNGQRYRNWETVTVTRSGKDAFSHFSFSAASPIESAPNWAGMKLAIGDACQVFLAGRQVINGRIEIRQPAFDANQHGLQVGGRSLVGVIGRATVDRGKGEFKKYSLTQIANSLLQPYGISFSLKGETSGADKPFEKVNVQRGETVFAAIERLCRMRNIYLFDDAQGNLVGYRLGSQRGAVADLEEGRNIKSATAVFNYQGSYSEIEAVLQRPGNDDHWGDDARDVSGKATNPAVRQHVPLSFMGEMPGDQRDAQMRAQHENGENLSTQIDVQITVQGWHKDDGSLWIEHVGDVVSAYSPMLFTNDRMNLAIQEVTSGQSGAGTTTTLGLVLPERFNGGGQIEGGPSIPGLTGGGV